MAKSLKEDRSTFCEHCGCWYGSDGKRIEEKPDILHLPEGGDQPKEEDDIQSS